MSNVGIVGAGVGGLHLGILLQRRGVDVTVYADRSGDQLAKGRLLNAVMHHHLTLSREADLGLSLWNADEHGWRHRYQDITGDREVRYSAISPGPSMAVDYRLYLPALMAAFEQLGGRLIVRQVQVDEVDGVAAAHDLLVVATGRDSMQSLFPVRTDLGRPPGVRRNICAALVHGIRRPDPEGVTLGFARGVGELIEFPMVTAQGRQTALLFEAVPGGPADELATSSPTEDGQAFEKKLLETLQHYPATHERVDTSSFALLGPRDVLRGAIAPAVRHGAAYLPSGKVALALGDAHVLVDPVMGQGANIASYSAHVVGEAILEDLAFDELFCRQVAEKREPLLHAAYDWTNLVLDSPGRLLQLHEAAAAEPAIAADFASRYPRPDLIWRTVATDQRVNQYLRSFDVEASSGTNGERS
ncbi:styrene monooxygenase/indole monooxygenase family protein [Nitriliruptor alkaliphilus]|uniref:styrene monooxygenase/indole monooxygenase family protein n=1 Tax=Nitriliruptor alkaliphilus TaxID=427918 RepID=UPI000695A775|nr:styrene monooxygenase/indole monooxygenase family protein [Nitriliruptor alkaliphilus]